MLAVNGTVEIERRDLKGSQRRRPRDSFVLSPKFFLARMTSTLSNTSLTNHVLMRPVVAWAIDLLWNLYIRNSWIRVTQSRWSTMTMQRLGMLKHVETMSYVIFWLCFSQCLRGGGRRRPRDKRENPQKVHISPWSSTRRGQHASHCVAAGARSCFAQPWREIARPMSSRSPDILVSDLSQYVSSSFVESALYDGRQWVIWAFQMVMFVVFGSMRTTKYNMQADKTSIMYSIIDWSSTNYSSISVENLLILLSMQLPGPGNWFGM